MYIALYFYAFQFDGHCSKYFNEKKKRRIFFESRDKRRINGQTGGQFSIDIPRYLII